MSKTSSEKLVAELVAEVPALKRLYDEHIAYYDELIPHVLFFDISGFVQRGFAAGTGQAPGNAAKILAYLEDAIALGDSDVANLISVSFLENLDPDGDGYGELRSSLGPLLRAELKWYERQ